MYDISRLRVNPRISSNQAHMLASSVNVA